MKRCIGSAKPHRTVFAFLQDITMLKKWFISAFPEIEKISQTLAPKLCQKLWKIELLMKRCIGSAKPHRSVFRLFARYYDAEEVIHKRISWNWEDISNSGPKAMPKIIKNWTFNEKVLSDPQNLTEPFFAFLQDITMLKKWFISAFPEIEKISQTLAPKLCQKYNKFKKLSAKPHRSVFRLFARYFIAFPAGASDPIPHRAVFRFFARYWSDSYQRISQSYLKLWPQSYAKNYEKLKF